MCRSSGRAAVSHTEVGTPLLETLLFAGVAPTFDTWVAAVGSDNYVATVTPGEQLVGGRQLELALVEDGVTLAQSSRSRSRSAWPLCRAYSSITWTYTHRRFISRFERGWTNVEVPIACRAPSQIDLLEERGEVLLRVGIISVVEGAV